jgi:hypothetical protein
MIAKMDHLSASLLHATREITSEEEERPAAFAWPKGGNPSYLSRSFQPLIAVAGSRRIFTHAGLFACLISDSYTLRQSESANLLNVTLLSE